MRAALVTPSLNRPQWHEQLFEQLRKQRDIELTLYVLDESKDPSPFFSKPRENVVYVHRPGPPRKQGVTEIGRARNALNRLVREDVLCHMDDDDVIDEHYAATCVDRLLSTAADIVKLDVWRLLVTGGPHDGYVYEWDTRKFGGWHFAMRGEKAEFVNVDSDMCAQEREAFRDAFHVGYGWSLTYRKSIWQRFPFPEQGTEDIPWLRAIRDAGGKIHFISDCPHLALHTVHVDNSHPEGGSPHFPQRVLGKLQGDVRRRMMGAAAAMQELPKGKPISIVPGTTYVVLALVKASHSVASLVARCATWGISVEHAEDNVTDPTVSAVDGYRLVRVTGVGSKPVTLPWSAPKFMQVIGERSRVEKAWVGAAGALEVDDFVLVRGFVGAGRTWDASTMFTGYASAIYGKPTGQRVPMSTPEQQVLGLLNGCGNYLFLGSSPSPSSPMIGATQLAPAVIMDGGLLPAFFRTAISEALGGAMPTGQVAVSVWSHAGLTYFFVQQYGLAPGAQQFFAFACAAPVRSQGPVLR